VTGTGLEGVGKVYGEAYLGSDSCLIARLTVCSPPQEGFFAWIASFTAANGVEQEILVGLSATSALAHGLSVARTWKMPNKM
jgi:hypothetical protein